jgi:tRNA 2-selenouridine synthase
MVLTEFENWQQKKPFIVLHGGTGVGKTDLLDELTKRNLPVLDLEGMANHRGSVFGAVGLGEQPPQKQFEGCLYDKINQLKNDSIFVEAESSKIGKVILPPFVKNGIRKGIVVWVICDKEMRVNRLIKEYIECDPKKYTKEMLSALAMIKQYLKKEIYIEIQSCLENHDFESAARLLLDEYYDPLYSKWKETYKGFSYTVDTSDFEQGVEQLVEIYNEVADKEY